MARLTLYCLGPLQLLLDGAPVTGFAYNKARTLLAYLAMSGSRPQYRTQLAGFFWPDLPEESARTNLRQALADLREAIGDAAAISPFLLVTRETVQLNPDGALELDVREFQALLDACEAHPHRHAERCDACAVRMAAAASLYRGDFLAQFILRNGAPFEDWALTQQEALRQRVLSALFHLCNYHERRGAQELVIRYARRQLELDAAREEAHRALMRAYAHSGLRSAALAQFDTCQGALRRELDVEPSPETRALYERVRDQWEHESGSAPAGLLRPLCDLPPAPAALIGRGRELAGLAERLADPGCRLLTIAGLGGSGKTRLALAAAAQSAFAFEHGAVFVELAPIDAAGLVAGAMLGALRVPADPQQEPQAQLLRYLADKELLLVLDNFEQVMDAAPLLASIAQRAPRVTMLVTSRERLALRAEQVFDLDGLPFPTGLPDEAPGQFESVQLFTERARQILPQFALSPDVATAVVQICQMVEGLPLAIELAASGVRRRSCAAIAAELTRHVQSLRSELRDMPERQRSLWATLEQSWALLSGAERSVLARLAVFRGGFETAAAASAAQATGALLDALADKSLLRRTPAGRCEMHELVRQFAFEKLVLAGDAAQAQNEHLAYYVSLAETAEPELLREAQVAWLKRLLAELGNVRSALAWSQAQEPGGALGLRLAGSLWHFWDMSGLLSEGRAWLRGALARGGGAPTRPQLQATNEAGRLALFQGDLREAQRLLREGLGLARQLGDAQGEATAQFGLGWAAFRSGNYRRGEVLYAASERGFRSAAAEWQTATVLNSWALLANARGDPLRAIGLLEQALATRKQLHDTWGTARSMKNLADLWFMQHDHVRARKLYDGSLLLFQELADLSGTAAVLRGQGLVAAALGDYPRAVGLLQDNLKHNAELGIRGAAATALADLGDVALLQGDQARALSYFRRALDAAREMQTIWDVVWCLEGFAAVAAACGQPARAAGLLCAVETLVASDVLRTRIGVHEDHGRKRAALQARLGPRSFEAAARHGRAWGLRGAIEKAMELSLDGADTTKHLR